MVAACGGPFIILHFSTKGNFNFHPQSSILVDENIIEFN